MRDLVPNTEGHLVDGHWMRLAEVIKDYDPYLELRWVPYEQRTRDDKEPYCVVDTRTNYVVLFAKEGEDPAEVLARIFNADNAQGDTLTRMDSRNNARQIMQMKERLDEEDLQRDFAAFLIKYPKHFVDMKNPITGDMMHLDEQLRRRL